MHKLLLVTGFLLLVAASFMPEQHWESSFVKMGKNGKLEYMPDAQGNVIPDFSAVGFYKGDKPIPGVKVVTMLSPSANAQQDIQSAINALAARPIGKDGFRGAILLKKGRYEIPGTIHIRASGIVLRGEGEETILVATGNTQYPLIFVNGNGSPKELPGKVKITDAYVPVGAASFNVPAGTAFKPGDNIIVYRPATQNWIHDIKMDQIESREGTKQWTPQEYGLQFERTITAVKGNRIFIDNPIVMAMEEKYGGGEVFPYSFEGRIKHVGIENLNCISTYSSDTAEDHAWDAVRFNRIENGWVRNVTARYFGYSCVNLGQYAKFITVTDSRCYDAKSKITGSRRYSFNNDGQMNLVMNCETTEGRHDFITGAKVAGPNVFYNCKSSRTHADIGPHHRWAVGTLYDNIVTDGEINVQDRGNWGTGHGWAGVTQVLWNCTVKRAAVQSPWASGKNYCIGLKGEKYQGRLPGRPDAEWEGQNKDGLIPKSLYMAQLAARRK
ncbi:MAG TPA: hypothetical protein VD996_18105 [Chitinophagaceae bacterium]|nr:hypothetical protein [Chitinophagaceae bacterium]